MTRILKVYAKRICRNDFCLKDVALSLEPGEALLVFGPSGSGKSTLAKAIVGIEGHVEGEIRVCGYNPFRDRRLLYECLVYVPQEPWRLPLGPTPIHEALLGCRSIVDAAKILKKLGLLDHANKPIHELSAGLIQRLVLTTLYVYKPKLVVLDEPTVYLDSDARSRLVEAVKGLLEEGASALIVDHDLARWRGIVSKLLVLKDGIPEYNGPYSDDVLDAYSFKFRVEKRPFTLRRISAKEILVLNNVWFRYRRSRWVLRGVKLRVRSGEITVVLGPNGSGKTTLLKVMTGIYKPLKGSRISHVTCLYVPENPILFFTMPTVYEEVVGQSKDPSYGEEILKKLRLWSIREKPLAKLSVGERRRVAIASALARGARLVALDEPLGGLDPWSAKAVLDLMVEFVDSGGAIVASSHDERLLVVANKSYLISEGRLREV